MPKLTKALRLFRPLPWFSARVPRGLLLVWDVAWVLGYLGAIAYTLHDYSATSRWSERRLLTVEQLRTQLAPLWPELYAVVHANAPPTELLVGPGGPLPALRALAASPQVDTAFYVSPDLTYTLLSHGADARPMSGSLPSWKPLPRVFHGLGPGPWTEAERSRHRALVLQSLHLRRLYEQRVLDQNDTSDSGLPLTGFTWVGTSVERLYEKRATRQGGLLGYWPPIAGKLTDDGSEVQRLLVKHGLAGLVAWSDDETYEPEPLGGPTALVSHLRIVDTQPLDDSIDRKEALILLPLGLLLLARLVNGVENLRALWNERAIALAQSNFVSAVSHEMRTPLTTIQLYAEMLEQDVVTDPLRRQQYLQTISQECQRMGRLVENVLDYASISGRRKAYRFEPLEARALVEEALAAMAGPLERAGMVAELHAPVPVTVSGDRDALVQSLVNLLGNAVKYGVGGGRVLVSVFPEGGSVAITVEDFGPGIPLAEQKKVFRPFYRVGNELTRTTTGSGLGLALVAETAKAHRGRVELVSEPGRGSLFRLVWPREQA